MNSAAYWALGISISLAITLVTLAWRLGLWQGEVNTDRSNFNAFMTEVRGDIKKILGLLPQSPVASSSPLQLTDLGKEISEEISAKKWAENESTTLLDDAKGKDQFGIQSMAFGYAKEFEPSEELLARMRTCAFQHGLELEGVRRVLGVVLRDCIFKKRGLLPPSLDHQDQD